MDQLRRPRVYISGPMNTGDDDVVWNVTIAKDIGRKLIGLGYAPLIPHLSYYMDPKNALGYETWIAIDFAWIRCAEVVWRIPGKSLGTEREIEFAKSLNIPVVSTIQELETVCPSPSGPS